MRCSRISRPSYLPSILPSILAAYFWLVVLFQIIDWCPSKAMMYLILYIFCQSICRPKRWDGVPPCAPLPTRLCSNIPSSISANYRVNCWLSSLIGGHLRPRPRLPLYFLLRLALVPQTREPTVALPNPTVRVLPMPIGSGDTMIWWCHWPTHGGRGLKLVEGRAAWLMLVVVCCCQHKKPCLSTISYCRQDYVCRGFNEDKKKLGSLLPILHPLSLFIVSPTYFASSQFTRRNRRLPSPTQINSSVSLSVCLSYHF